MQLFKNSEPSGRIGQLWLGLWVFLLAFGWILPNHYPPWPNFHSDTWIAAVMMAMAGAVTWKARNVAWYRLPLVAAVLVAVPFVQFASGQLVFAGQAWTPSAYLLGLALALVVGAQWERLAPGQAVNGLFMAIGAAAIASVGIQLYQWLLAYGLNVWVLPSFSSRVHANFGQPNLLATFLLWGLVACGWGVCQRQIRTPVAMLMAVYLLFGIALTQSRTALVAVLFVAAGSWLVRPLGQPRSTPWVLTGLALGLVACLASMDSFNGLLLLDVDMANLMEKTRNESRLVAYRLFLDAALQSPWWGYGWNELGGVQLAVAQNHPRLGGFFFHSHNLFLDLILWCGIPLGGLIIVACLAWLARRIRQARDQEDVLLLLFIGFVAWHAMTELPLHYASFLLPTGIIMGVLDARKGQPVRTTGRWPLVAVWAVAATVLALLAKDYFRVEANFYALRFERARISERPPLEAPDVVLLTQLREYIRLARTVPTTGMSPQQIQWVRDAATAQPSEASLFTLIMALALNGRVEEAQLWVARVSKVTAPEVYANLKAVWQYEASRAPQLLAVKWPEY